MPGWVIKIVVSFVLRQLAKYAMSVDWAKVKADAAARVAAIVPGEWLDADAVAVVNEILGAIERAMSDQGGLKRVVDAALKGDWSAALDALKDLVLGSWQPVSVAEIKAHAMFKAAL